MYIHMGNIKFIYCIFSALSWRGFSCLFGSFAVDVHVSPQRVPSFYHNFPNKPFVSCVLSAVTPFFLFIFWCIIYYMRFLVAGELLTKVIKKKTCICNIKYVTSYSLLRCITVWLYWREVTNKTMQKINLNDIWSELHISCQNLRSIDTDIFEF